MRLKVCNYLFFFFLWREKNLEKVSQNFEFRSHNYKYFLGILSSHLTIIIIFPPQKVIVTFYLPILTFSDNYFRIDR